jgi:cyanophycin synthetase
MFAAAICFSQGIALEDIRHGLRTFATSFFQAPGRMNVFDEHPFKVILDYGHNPKAIQSMTDVADKLDVSGKRIVSFTLPGDRRNEDMEEAAGIVAGHFDRYICRRDDNPRGRGDDEVPKLIAGFLRAKGVPEDAISVIPEEQEATKAALEMAEPGDLVLVFGDNITRTWKQIIYHGKNRPSPEAEEGTEPAPGGKALQRPAAGTPQGPITEKAPDLTAERLPSGMRMIRDERGVRLAAEPEEAD